MNASHSPVETMRHGGTALRLEGRDALAVLHRISTAGLEDLAIGEARATLFCDFRARLLHRAAVARARDGALWLIRADAPPATLLAHLERHVFREDLRASERDPAPISVRYGTPLTRGVIEEQPGYPPRVRLVSGEIFEWSHQPPLDEPARIRAGLPRDGHEIQDSFHPFEVGLAAEVHLSKGCYTGQEVLQRLVTYESVRRRLVRISGEGPAPAPGASLFTEGRPAGILSSVARDGHGFVALAVMKREAIEARVEVEGTEVPARVETFPEVQPLGLP